MAELVVCAATGALEPLMEKLAAAVGEEYKRLKGVRREVGSPGSHACLSSQDVGGGEPRRAG